MKKILCFLMLCAVLLPGCSRHGNPVLEPVYFYYPRLEYDYGSEDSVITWEAIDGAGHMTDYVFLLGQYFSGPVDESLVNPFPEGTALVSFDLSDTAATVVLSIHAQAMEEPDFSLAGSCLSMTCLEILPVDEVVIISGSRSVTTHRDGLLFVDEYMPEG